MSSPEVVKYTISEALEVGVGVGVGVLEWEDVEVLVVEDVLGRSVLAGDHAIDSKKTYEVEVVVVVVVDPVELEDNRVRGVLDGVAEGGNIVGRSTILVIPPMIPPRPGFWEAALLDVGVFAPPLRNMVSHTFALDSTCRDSQQTSHYYEVQQTLR
jgi:hypothetical protein